LELEFLLLRFVELFLSFMIFALSFFLVFRFCSQSVLRIRWSFSNSAKHWGSWSSLLIFEPDQALSIDALLMNLLESSMSSPFLTIEHLLASLTPPLETVWYFNLDFFSSNFYSSTWDQSFSLLVYSFWGSRYSDEKIMEDNSVSNIPVVRCFWCTRCLCCYFSLQSPIPSLHFLLISSEDCWESTNNACSFVVSPEMSTATWLQLCIFDSTLKMLELWLHLNTMCFCVMNRHFWPQIFSDGESINLNRCVEHHLFRFVTAISGTIPPSRSEEESWR